MPDLLTLYAPEYKDVTHDFFEVIEYEDMSDLKNMILEDIHSEANLIVLENNKVRVHINGTNFNRYILLDSLDEYDQDKLFDAYDLLEQDVKPKKELVIYNFGNDIIKGYKNVKVTDENDIADDYVDNIENYFRNYIIYKKKRFYLRNHGYGQYDKIDKRYLKFIEDEDIHTDRTIVEVKMNENTSIHGKVLTETKNYILVEIRDISCLYRLRNLKHSRRNQAFFEKVDDKYRVYNAGNHQNNFMMDHKTLIISNKHFEFVKNYAKNKQEMSGTTDSQDTLEDLMEIENEIEEIDNEIEKSEKAQEKV
ncbi:hypothetical protein JA1_003709 [Spathaspora sp. JA1]|nr:hypothetical protein JA1_003709 [Spathaspora sp. JA1]